MEGRKVENEPYLSALRDIVSQGNEVRLNVRGLSMMPFLFDGRDSVIISYIDSELKKGDIVIYQRLDGTFIMHRICRTDRKNKQYYLVGDAQSTVEGPIGKAQIFGRITKVCRNGKWISQKNPVWFFYKKIWMIFRPFRQKLLLKFLACKRKVKNIILKNQGE